MGEVCVYNSALHSTRINIKMHIILLRGLRTPLSCSSQVIIVIYLQQVTLHYTDKTMQLCRMIEISLNIICSICMNNLLQILQLDYKSIFVYFSTHQFWACYLKKVISYSY